MYQEHKNQYQCSKHKNIEFTFETEDSNIFSFLDVKITRKNKPLLTSESHIQWSFTNSDSFIFDTDNIGLVHIPLFRFFKICSSMEQIYRRRT